jgi:hypothetical protein
MSLDTLNVGSGQQAEGATAAGGPVRVGGTYNSTAPTLTNGQAASHQLDASGNLKVTQANGVAAGTAGSPSAQVLSVQGESGMTPIQTLPALQTAGGPGEVSYIMPATATVETVKTTAGQVYMLRAYNTGASPVYLKWFDGAATIGSTSANYQEIIPAGGSLVVPFRFGKPFVNAIRFAVTGAIGLADATAITANTVVVNIAFQ